MTNPVEPGYLGIRNDSHNCIHSGKSILHQAPAPLSDFAMINRQIKLAGSGKFVAVLAGAAAGGQSTAGAADLGYISPVFTSNNVVGWLDDNVQSTSFLINVTGNRAFRASVTANAPVYGVVFNRFSLYPHTFKIATDAVARSSSSAVQMFGNGQTFGAAFGNKNQGVVGRLFSNQIADGMVVDPEKNRYLLFQFQDSSTVYNGWINVDIRVVEAIGLAKMQNYVRINQYAWQSSTLGTLPSGTVPVPEPSTLVTSGIAALTGGAVALRRWRKQRKAQGESA